MTLGKTLLIGLSCLLAVKAVPLASEENEVAGGRSTDAGDLNLLLQYWKMCNVDVACYLQTGTMMVARVGRMQNIQLTDGVSLVSTGDSDAIPSDEDIKKAIAADPENRSSRAMDLLIDTTVDVVSRRSLVVDMKKTSEDLQRALQDESRGKKKKLLKTLLPIILGVGLKMAALIPVGIGVIGLIAAKALLVSKIALVLGAILAVQKLLGSKKGGSGGGVGWSADASAGGASAGPWASGSGGSSGGWYRSLDAHDMAFASQKPQPATQ